jgi:DNA adenine methylase
MTPKAPSPLRYPGGKSRAISQILPLLPPSFRDYGEPFIGGGSVFLAVKSAFQSQVERYWINDLNPDLVAFWRQTQGNVEALTQQIIAHKVATSNGRDLYDHFLKTQGVGSEFERAVRFFILNRITFSGVVDSGGYSQQAFEKRFTESSIERVRKVAPLLQSTQITHGDYESVVTAEGESVFIFLDPPYRSATRSKLYGVGGQLHTGFDHARFAEIMRHCPHQWLITYDDDPLVRDYFHFAHIHTWQLQYGMNNYKQGSAAKGDELFISNYALPLSPTRPAQVHLW